MEVPLAESDEAFTVSGDHFTLVFDRAAGTIGSFVYRETELIAAGPRPCFWRAPLDNDRGAKMPERCGVWRSAGEDWEIRSVSARKSSDNVVIRVEGTLPAVEANYTVEYTILPTADVVVDVRYNSVAAKLPELPRFGVQMELPGGFEQFTWYGRGPHESYWDRKSCCPVGLYETTVAEQFVDYSRPQENGAKTDVRWAAFTNESGTGLLAVGMPLLTVTAGHYRTADLDAAEHRYELTAAEQVIVHLDHRQMGVGGDNSWGARPHPEYTLKDKSYEYSFRLRPFQDESPNALGRQVVAER